MFFITVLLVILGLMGTDLFVPSLPEIAQVFHQTPNITQLTISLFLSGFALSQLFYGPISDRIGRRLPLLFGIAIFIAGSLLCIFNFKSFTVLCLGRIIQGLGVGAGLSLSRVILRDYYRGTELAIKTSKIAIFVSVTPAIAPFLGGILQQHFGYRSSFIFMLCYGIGLWTLLKTNFKETLQQKNSSLTVKNVLSQYVKILKNRFFVNYTIIAGLAFSSLILYANMMPFIIQTELQLSPIENGAFILIAAMGICLGAFISNRTLKKVSSEFLVLAGLKLFLFSGFLLVFSSLCYGTDLYFLVPFLFLITLGCGIIFPNALALCFSAIDCNIGIAGAIYGTMQTFISMLVNILLNTIHHQGQSLMGIFYLLFGFCGLILYFTASHKPQNRVKYAFWSYIKGRN